MPVSLNSTLASARSALVANQAAMQVVSDNIANATTPGYTRKRAEIVTGPAQILPEGVFGTGVVVRDVSRARDRFLDGAYRDASGSRQQQQIRFEYLEQVEGAFGEPDSGLAGTLDAFWNSWSDLANDPLNQSARGVIRERGVQLVAQVHRLWNSVEAVRASATRRLDADLAQVNELSARIAQLNEEIVAAEAGGHTAGQLRDERDLAIDGLAGLANIQVMERANGGTAVALDGITIVDGNGYQPLLPADTSALPVRLRTSNGTELNPSSGSLSAYLTLLNSDLPAIRTELNELATSIATAVNAIHGAGVNPEGQKVDFFRIADATRPAQSLDLAPEVKQDARQIAAGYGGDYDAVTDAWEYRSGTNEVANRLAALRTSPEITGAYTDLVADVGLRTRAAADNARAQAALAGQAANRRDSLMGVSTDEEMVDLIRLQKAYGAAARVITTADEMLQTLLDIKR